MTNHPTPTELLDAIHELKEATPPGAPPIERLAEIVRVARDTETELDLATLASATRAYAELLRAEPGAEWIREGLESVEEIEQRAREIRGGASS